MHMCRTGIAKLRSVVPPASLPARTGSAMRPAASPRPPLSPRRRGPDGCASRSSGFSAVGSAPLGASSSGARTFRTNGVARLPELDDRVRLLGELLQRDREYGWQARKVEQRRRVRGQGRRVAAVGRKGRPTACASVKPARAGRIPGSSRSPSPTTGSAGQGSV